MPPPEFIALLGRHLNLQPRFVDTRFANLILGVNAQRFDVVASALYVTPERARQVDLLSYLKAGSSLMGLASSDFRPQQPEDLCGKRVGSIKGASWIPKLNTVSAEHCLAAGKPAIESREYPTSPEAAQALLAQDRENWQAFGTHGLRFHQPIVGLLRSPLFDEFFANVAAQMRLVFSSAPSEEGVQKPWLERDRHIHDLLGDGRKQEAIEALGNYLDDSESVLLDILGSARKP